MVDLLKCFTTGCTKSVRDAFTLPRLPNVLYRDEMWPVAAVLCVPQYCSMALFDKVYAHRLVDSAADTSVVERPEINNEERLKVIDDVESCRTQHDGYATNSTRKDAVQIDDDQKFIEFEDIERWWKELTETHHDDYAIVFDIIKKCSKQDFLSPRDFEPILDEVTQRHPALEFLSSLRVFQDRYAETVITRIFYSKINNCNERMTLAEFRKQAVLEILIQLQLDDDINSTHHVFSYKHFYVIYCTFWELDTDHNMIVEASDMFRYGGGALTDMMMKRVVGGYGKPLALGTASKQLTYKDYIWFMLCVEDKRTVASIEYWFRCLDADGDGVLKFAELREFYDQQVNKMIDYGIREPFKRDEFDCQVVNLIKPESPEYLTLSDLLRTPENAAILFDILFDATNYNTRIRRMDPEFREKEEVWIEEEVGSVDGGGGGDVCLKRVKLEGWNKFAERMYETLADKEAGGGDGGGSTGAVDAGPRSLRRLEDDEDDMRGNYLNRGEFDSEEDDGWG
ncbi:hypothetical protein BDR26DRAFT_856096 [Obelidium mucronatum]|nr:hypothetical protein BDR26DRAFT_856096 [Obelidium mucronatum]